VADGADPGMGGADAPYRNHGSAEPARSARPTLRQVAELAGVSVKTASRALNGEVYVSQGTSARVLAAAEQLGFRLNGIASELRRGGTSSLVGFVTGDLANPFYSRLASGIERELRPLGLQLVTANTDEDPDRERRLIEALLQRRVQALLLVSTAGEHAFLARDLRRGVPLVFVDRPAVGLLADTVLLDNRRGAAEAIRHLVSGGHRRIGVVGDLSRLATHHERLEGVAEAMTEAGIPEWHELLRTDAHDVAAAESSARELLDLADPPTALFTTNNRITSGALRALRGVADPPALVGFDDFDLGDVLGITVIGYDVEEMGRRAARLALQRLSGSDEPARTVIMPTRLVTRGSGERPPRQGIDRFDSGDRRW
jgi:LacI family transcriptional regulator